VGGSVEWKSGPFYITYAYEKHDDQVGSTGTAGKQETGHALGGTFAFGPLRVGLLAEKFKKDDRKDQKAWLGNLVWTIGNNQLIYQYGQQKDGGLNVAATQPDCNSNVFAWQYNFSKRTFFLAQYTQVKNDNIASQCGSNTFNAAPFTIAGGQDPKGVSLGLSHVF